MTRQVLHQKKKKVCIILYGYEIDARLFRDQENWSGRRKKLVPLIESKSFELVVARARFVAVVQGASQFRFGNDLAVTARPGGRSACDVT